MPDQPPCQHDIRFPENSMVYKWYATKEALVVHFWQCRYCGDVYEKEWFRYFPQDCPQHIQEFVGWMFNDDSHRYQLGRFWKCAMCGISWFEPCDVRSYGNREITIDNPEVERVLLFTPSVRERLLKGEE